MNFKKMVVTQLVLMMIVASSVAVASDQDADFYVSGMLTYIDPDSDFNLDNELAGGQIGIGKAFSEHLDFELEIDYLDVSGDNGGGDANFLGGAVNALYIFDRPAKFSPYVIGGIGMLDYDPDGGSSSTRTQVQGGAGFLYDIGSKRLALRAEVLGRWADYSSSTTDLLVNFGVQYSFGGGDSKPASQPAPVVMAAPQDTDGDGINDADDQCPGTPAGVVVDAVGCALDTDGDGVADGIDQCPDSIEGALIDDRGCGYQLSGVNFGFDSAELAPSATSLLNEVAERLTQFADINITIEGYTDDRGADDYNMDLSKRRAQSAKTYLESKDVAAARMTVVGFGEANPIASNDTEDGRAENRRVVLKVDQ